MNIRTTKIPNRDVFPSKNPACSYNSSDETKFFQEANNEGQLTLSSNFSSNSNYATDSNGESAKHRRNYAFHHLIKIWHTSKEWTIAILLKLSLVAWDMWTYRIGFKLNKKISNAVGNLTIDGARN